MSARAFAQDFRVDDSRVGPYVGVRTVLWLSEFEIASVRADGMREEIDESALMGGAIFGGLRYADRSALEFGYELTTSSDLDAHVFSIGANFFFPIEPGLEFAVRAAALLGVLDEDPDLGGEFEEQFGAEAGVGVHTTLLGGWRAHVTGSVRYLKFNFEEDPGAQADDSSIGGLSAILSLGIYYQF